MAEHKFAEKLAILNDHALGLLTRLSGSRQLFMGASRPPFLHDKSMEGVIKGGLKRFPACEFPTSQASPLYVRREEILSHLQDHYFCLVDCLEFKDAVLEVVTALSAQMVALDLQVSFGLTAAFLDLVQNYACVMLLLSRLGERRMIAGMFNAAYSMVRGTSEPSYPRLGQLIVEYENPLKRMHEEFLVRAAAAPVALLPCLRRWRCPCNPLRLPLPGEPHAWTPCPFGPTRPRSRPIAPRRSPSLTHASTLANLCCRACSRRQRCLPAPSSPSIASWPPATTRQMHIARRTSSTSPTTRTRWRSPSRRRRCFVTSAPSTG